MSEGRSLGDCLLLLRPWPRQMTRWTPESPPLWTWSLSSPAISTCTITSLTTLTPASLTMCSAPPSPPGTLLQCPDLPPHCHRPQASLPLYRDAQAPPTRPLRGKGTRLDLTSTIKTLLRRSQGNITLMWTIFKPQVLCVERWCPQIKLDFLQIVILRSRWMFLQIMKPLQFMLSRTGKTLWKQTGLCNCRIFPLTLMRDIVMLS